MFGGGSGHRLGDGSGSGSGGAYGRVEEDYCGGSCLPVAIVCGLLLAISSGGLAVMCLGSVPPLQYGIRYNHFTKGADLKQVYGPGRYFIGPFNKFLYFPSTVQSIEFAQPSALRPAGARYEPLHTRTKEGLGLYLQVTMQYKLMGDHIGRLYDEFNQNYEQVYTSSIRDILIKAASEYEATQLWEERQKFGDIMQQMVNEELTKSYAVCWGLQLLVIDLPDDYETSITSTQIQKQNMLMREQEQISAQIRAETTVIQAEFRKKVKVVMAEGQANYTVMTKEAQARAQQKKIEVESDILGQLKVKLQLSADGLVNYQKYGAMDDMEGATLFYGFSGPSTMMMKSAR